MSKRTYPLKACIICGEEFIPGSPIAKYCSDECRRESKRRALKENMSLLDKHGICHKCQKAKCFQGYKYCAECLEKIAESNIKRYDPVKAHAYQNRRKELYKEHKEKGICVRCSKPAARGLYCLEHSIEAKKRSQDNAQRRKRQRHERGLIPEYRKEHGLCCYCGKPVENPKILRACNACREKFSKISYRGDKTFFKSWKTAFFNSLKNGQDEKASAKENFISMIEKDKAYRKRGNSK